MMTFFDRKGRRRTEPACEKASEIGKLAPKRKEMFLALAKDLDKRAPETAPTETDDNDCVKCGWPADEHRVRKN